MLFLVVSYSYRQDAATSEVAGAFETCSQHVKYYLGLWTHDGGWRYALEIHQDWREAPEHWISTTQESSQGDAEVREGSEQEVILKRNNTFMFAPSEGRFGAELYRVVNLFRKKSVKGSKWLLHTEAAANKDTIVHA